MNLSLRLMHIEQLRRLDAGGRHIDAIPVIDGALPPPFVVGAALKALVRGDDPLWSSFFMFVESDPARASGSGGFKGPPVAGRVEIGYNVAESRRGRGIAVAAVLEMLTLAFARPQVGEVRAETGADNFASRRVVEKAGFRHAGQRLCETEGRLDRWLVRR
jgi:GNAT superfamily N-acetyltransferase